MQRIGYILRSYPRRSQTFILNEILALEQVGQNLHLFAITNPREPIVQAQVAAVRAPVEYLEDAGKRGRLAILSEHIRAAASGQCAISEHCVMSCSGQISTKATPPRRAT